MVNSEKNSGKYPARQDKLKRLFRWIYVASSAGNPMAKTVELCNNSERKKE
jgi:hypothetical protein